MVYSLHSQFIFDLIETETDFEQAWRLQDRRKTGRDLPGGCRAPKLLQYRQVAAFADQIERLYSILAESRVRVLLLDDLRHSPRVTYAKLLEFLKLPIDDRQDFPVLSPRKDLRRKWIKQLDQRVPIRDQAGGANRKEASGSESTTGIPSTLFNSVTDEEHASSSKKGACRGLPGGHTSPVIIVWAGSRALVANRVNPGFSKYRYCGGF
jgi:hypothetical protein